MHGAASSRSVRGRAGAGTWAEGSAIVRRSGEWRTATAVTLCDTQEQSVMC